MPRFVVSFRAVEFDWRKNDWDEVSVCVEAADAAEAQVFARAEAQLAEADRKKWTGWQVVGERRLLVGECPCCAQGVRPVPKIFEPTRGCNGCGRLPEDAEKEFRRMRRMPGGFL